MAGSSLPRRVAERRYVSPILDVLLAVALGEHDRAFACLEKAFEDRVQMMSELRAEPLFDPLRPDPRFADLLRRVGLAGTA